MDKLTKLVLDNKITVLSLVAIGVAVLFLI